MRLRTVLAALAVTVMVCATVVAARSSDPDIASDLSLLDMSLDQPLDMHDSETHAGLGESVTRDQVAKLHEAAGSIADEAIAEARMASMLLETNVAANTVAGAGKWDASVPEVHLKTAQPDEFLSTELETVDHLERSHPGLTKELELPNTRNMAAAFPQNILGEDHVFIQSRAVAETATHSDAEVEAVVVATSEVDVDAQADADAATVTEAEAAAGVVTMSELTQMMEMQGMSRVDIEAYMENLGQTTVETEMEAETETEAEAEAESESESESETESESDSESETDAHAAELLEIEQQAEAETEVVLSKEELDQIQAEADAEVAHEQALLESDAESDSESETETDAEQEMSSDMDIQGHHDSDMDLGAAASASAESHAAAASQDDMVHLSAHAAPERLEESRAGVVTPVHSRSWNRRHPVLRRMASVPPEQSGYSLPQAGSPDQAMLQTRARAHSRSHSRMQARDELDTEKFNPSAIQLGPSKDAYGYQPMTGAEFLQSPSTHASLAQVSMQMQNQQGTWLPPPVEAEATPNYVVGMGGLQPNRNAGPYQGQYGLAAGGQPVPQEPSFLQY